MIAQVPFVHAADVHTVPFGDREVPVGTSALIGITRFGGGDVTDVRHSSTGTTWTARTAPGTRHHGMPTPPPVTIIHPTR